MTHTPPRYLEITETQGRILAVGDIHGCAKTLSALIYRWKPQQTDMIILLGDLINRGPSSAAAIEEVLRLRSSGIATHCLLGNHEVILRNMLTEGDNRLNDFVRRFHSRDLLNHDGKLKDAYQPWLDDLYHYIVFQSLYFVHGGLDFSKEKPLNDGENMPWIRKSQPDEQWAKERHIIHGHSPTPLHRIREAIEKRSPVIPLDNGCVYKDMYEGCGRLTALEWPSWTLHVQDNVDLC